MNLKKIKFCFHIYKSEKIRNISCRGGYYEKLTCIKCGKVKIYY